MGVEIIAQQGVVAGAVTLGGGLLPAFGGDSAIPPGMAILGSDEIPAQRRHLRVAGADNDRCLAL